MARSVSRLLGAEKGSGRPAGTTLNRSTAETVLSGLSGQLIVMVSGVVVARMLGVANRGHFALIALLPLVLSQVGTLGLPVAMTYYIAQGVSARAIIRTARLQAVGQVVVLVLVHAAIAWLLFGNQSGSVKLSAALSLLVTPAATAQVWGLAVLQGERRYRSFNLLRLVGGATYSFALAGIYVAGQGDIIQATVAWLVGTIVSCVVICFVAFRTGARSGDSKAAPTLRDMYGFGLTGLLGSVFPIETFSLDQFYVGIVLSPAALGLYVVGAAFTNLTRFFLPQSIGMIAYPQVASSSSLSVAQKTVWHFFLFAMALCGAIVAVLEVVIGWLIPFLFGHRFSGAVPVSRILLLGSWFLAGRRVLAEGTRGAGLPSMGAASELMALIVAVPALFIASGGGLTSVTWALTSAYGASLGLIVIGTAVIFRLASSSSRWRPEASGS